MSYETPHFSELEYSADNYDIPREVGNILREGERRSEPSSWDDITGCPPTATNVRKAVVWTASSVQTRTEVLDSIPPEVFGDFAELKDAITGTHDGQVKWACVHEFYTGDKAQTVAKHARNGDWVKAIAELAGLEENGGKTDAHYLRVTKANLVTAILGDPHALCLDSARRRALEPLLAEMFKDDPRRGAHTYYVDAPYRAQGTSVDTDMVYPRSQEFLEDRLARNPVEYRAITKAVLETLEDSTSMNRREISHTLFLVGSDTETHHEGLKAMLDY